MTQPYSTAAAHHRPDSSQLSRAVFFLQTSAQIHETGSTTENKKDCPAHRTTIGIKCLLPMLAQDTGKTENESARPEDGTGTGNQDKYSGAFYHHAEYLSRFCAKNPCFSICLL
jgi:hypothetical protein